MKSLLLTAAGIGGTVALAAALVGANGPGTAPEETPLVLSGDGQATAYHASAIHLPGGRIAEDAYLLVQDGKVVDIVEAGRLPAFTKVVDLGDAHLTPGLVAASSTVSGNSGHPDRSMAAQMLAIDSFEPFQDTTKVLERGITTYYLSPSSRRLIGGRGAVVKAAGEERMLLTEGDLMVNLTPEAWNPPAYFRPPLPPTAENPLLPAQAQAPNSRPGAMMALRQAMAPEQADSLNGQGLQAWAATDAPLRLRVDSADEAASGMELAAKWNHAVVLDGLDQANGDQLAALLGTQSATVLFAVPLFASLPELSDSWQAPAPDLLAKLGSEASIALRPGRYGRWTWLQEAAAAAVAYGLDESQAFAGITEMPARALGVADRVGSLRKGLDADFVVWSSSPLDGAAAVQSVYIDGSEVWNTNDVPREVAADAVVVRGGTLWRGEGAPLTGGVEVLLADGKVVAAGKTVPHPPGARLVDAGENAHLTPGFVDAGGRLGIGRARSVDPRADLRRLADGSLFSDQWLPVAQAGVTSMVLAPPASSAGVSGALVKTADDGSHVAMEDHRIVFFDVRNSDPAKSRGALKKTLDGGKGYADKWVKHREERAKWAEDQATKGDESRAEREKELRIRLAQGSAPAKEEVEEETDESGAEEVVEEEEVPVDPLNGLWEGTIEHEMLPEPVPINVRFHHEGKQVTALLSSPDDPSGETLELEGTFENNVVHFELPTEVGTVMMDGTITGPDVMEMHVELAGIGSVDFTMSRIEIEEAGAAPIARKRAKKDDGPAAPGIDWRKEGLRALFEGRGVAVVTLATEVEFTEAEAAFGAHKLPWLAQISGTNLDLIDHAQAAGIGVVLGPDVVVRKDNQDLVPAALYRAAGVPVVFRSNAGLGARFLPQLLTMATRYGLGAEDAMAGLTSVAADQLGVASRVGRLQPGLDGDLVVFSGHPFDLRSRVTQVFVNGKEVPQP